MDWGLDGSQCSARNQTYSETPPPSVREAENACFRTRQRMIQRVPALRAVSFVPAFQCQYYMSLERGDRSMRCISKSKLRPKFVGARGGRCRTAGYWPTCGRRWLACDSALESHNRISCVHWFPACGVKGHELKNDAHNLTLTDSGPRCDW